MDELIVGNTYQNKSVRVLIPVRDVNAGNWMFFLRLANLAYPVCAPNNRLVVAGDEVGVAYTKLFELAQSQSAGFALTLEDDMLIEPNTLLRLMKVLDAHPELAAVSALYYAKGAGAMPYILGDPTKDGDFTPGNPTDGLVEVNGTGMGCMLWRMSMFADVRLKRPWFQTTDTSSQDIYFFRQARKLGYRFAVDCANRVGHLDVTTGVVY